MIRVLHCPDIVGGNPQSLARAERELGLDSWSIAFRQSVYSYPCDEILLKPTDGMAVYLLAMWRLFWRGLFGYDFIHYNFGTTIFPAHALEKLNGGLYWFLAKIWSTCVGMIDLSIYHTAGKGIAVTFQGDDARQGDYSLKHFEISITKAVEPGYYTSKSDAGKRNVIAKFDRFADLIYYLNPDLGHVLPGRAKFLPYAHVDLREWKPVKPIWKSCPLVVHAPSHRGAKGTDVIIKTVERLRSEGVDFEFRLVEGVPNQEARKIYEQADLLIDQLYVGWYGGLAVELMALGKPVISYIREADLKFIPDKMRREIPVINATAGTLHAVLKHWLSDRDSLLRVGSQSREYVEKWHDPHTIAAQLGKDYSEVLLTKPVYSLTKMMHS